MGSLLSLLMLTGAGIGPGMADMIIAERRERFNKWEKFINFLANALLNLYLWYRGVPTVKDAAGGTPSSVDETNALLKAKYKDDLVYEFFRSVVRDGVALLLELLRPSAMEETLMKALLGRSSGFGMNLGGGTTVVQQLPPTGQRTAAQVRAGGPSAAQAIVLPDGTVLSN